MVTSTELKRTLDKNAELEEKMEVNDNRMNLITQENSQLKDLYEKQANKLSNIYETNILIPKDLSKHKATKMDKGDDDLVTQL